MAPDRGIRRFRETGKAIFPFLIVEDARKFYGIERIAKSFNEMRWCRRCWSTVIAKNYFELLDNL